MFSPRFIAVLVGVGMAGLSGGWFLEGTTSTANLQRLIDGIPTFQHQAGDTPDFAFNVDTTKSDRRVLIDPARNDYAAKAVRAIEAGRARSAAMQASAPTSACALPAPGDTEQIVFINLYEGQAMSSVAIGDVYHETRAADVDVQPGDRPLYVILNSFDGMLWRFKGATQRVAHLVLLTEATAADGGAVVGAVGILADKISTAPDRACFTPSYDDGGSLGQASAVANLRQVLGREPDVVGATHAAAALQVPSAMAAKVGIDFTAAPRGLDEQVWQDARRFTPAGVFLIAAQDVRGPEAATPYDILPGRAGIAQLVASGALTATTEGYRIAKPIAHFPAGLDGSVATTFVLGAGVPAPGGGPRFSCVLDEATQRPLAGCR